MIYNVVRANLVTALNKP